jgi:cellobiose transport system permease protein
MAKVKRGKVVRYNKWGYIFLIPFVAVYVLFQLIPLFRTFYYSFFENYRSGLTQIGPNFIGFGNYAKMLSNPDLWMYTKNTLIMWVLGFVPQIIISLLLGAWFSDPSLRLKGQRFFKTVIYLPNLIMASVAGLLFTKSSSATTISFMMSSSAVILRMISLTREALSVPVAPQIQVPPQKKP